MTLSKEIEHLMCQTSKALQERIHYKITQAIEEVFHGDLTKPEKKPNGKVTPLTEKQKKQAMEEILKDCTVKSAIIAKRLGFRTQQVAAVKAHTHKNLGGKKYIERILKV